MVDKSPAPGVIMDTLFAEWDAERGAPPVDIAVWASRELDRAFAESAKLQRADGAAGV